MTYFHKNFFDLYYRTTKFSEAFPQRLWGQTKFFNACSGLPTHSPNYCKMLEFAKKKFVKINSPYSTYNKKKALPLVDRDKSAVLRGGGGLWLGLVDHLAASNRTMEQV
jgi:hypothetical protein